MKLKGVEFGNVFTSSGTLNFFGQGWWYHRLFKILFPRLFDFSGATFTAKTTTLPDRKGNMPLKKNLHPRRLLPDCIKVYPFKKVALNAVSLSGPGAKYLFNQNIWQNFKNPFGISFMSVASLKEERLQEAKNFKILMQKELPFFSAPVFIQINISCPNTEHCPTDLIDEALEIMEIFSELRIPLDLKVNIFAKPDFIKQVEESGLCDVITCSNTIPFKDIPYELKMKLFGATISPLEKYGGGGMSGLPLFYMVADWLKKIRQTGTKIPIKAGGGIIYPHQTTILKKLGAQAIEIGSVSFLRPMNVQRIIKAGNKEFGGQR